VRLCAERARGNHEGLDVVVVELEHTIGLPWAGAWCGAVRSELALANGDFDLARTTIDAALDATLERPFARKARSRCLLTGSRIRRACGLDDAEEVAFQALATAESAGLYFETIEALELLASYAVNADACEFAARLIGAATRARSDIGAPAPPLIQPEIDETIATLHDSIEAERLETLFEEGSALDLVSARAYAERGRGTRRRPASGWQSLTPTELRVVELAATGMKNADIAARMFVSVPTVKTHLVHIFTKLNVATRAELAARAAQRS
jgi:DNA-binding CsgD family transcriptional regulator